MSSQRSLECLFKDVRDAPLKVVCRALEKAGPRTTSATYLGQNLLFFAVQRKEDAAEVCRILIEEYQVSPNQVDSNGQTALHYTAKTQNLDCIDILCENGANINHVDTYHAQSPLFYAAHYGGAGMVRRMLKLKADCNVLDLTGKSPLGWSTSTDVAKELAAEWSFDFVPGEIKSFAPVEMVEQKRCYDVLRYLSLCSDVSSIPGCQTWAVQDDDVYDMSGYACALACKADVKLLCALECEFIQDHRSILGKHIPDADLYKQIGLNPSASSRENVVRHIAQGDVVKPGKVKHYTLVCHHIPAAKAGTKLVARAANMFQKVVGYLYFRICEAEQEDEVQADSLTHGAAAGALVISHIKVSREHQNRGVATLLLSGMLQVALRDAGVGLNASGESANISCMRLSVAEKNQAAKRLYRKLGFNETDVPDSTDWPGWVSMRRYPSPAPGGSSTRLPLRAIMRRWLSEVWRVNRRPEKRQVDSIQKPPKPVPSAAQRQLLAFSQREHATAMQRQLQTVDSTPSTAALSARSTLSQATSSSTQDLSFDQMLWADPDESNVQPQMKRRRYLRNGESYVSTDGRSAVSAVSN